MLNVIHREVNGKTYANVATIGPVPSMIRQAGLPKPVNKNQMFMISEPDMELFETFGKGLKEKITSSPEWQARGVTAPTGGFEDMDDSIPF